MKNNILQSISQNGISFVITRQRVDTQHALSSMIAGYQIRKPDSASNRNGFQWNEK